MFNILMFPVRFLIAPLSVVALILYLYSFFSKEKESMQNVMFISLKVTGLLNLLPLTLMVVFILHIDLTRRPEMRLAYVALVSVFAFLFLSNAIVFILRKKEKIENLRILLLLLGLANLFVSIISAYVVFAMGDAYVTSMCGSMAVLHAISGIFLLCELNNPYGE